MFTAYSSGPPITNPAVSCGCRLGRKDFNRLHKDRNAVRGRGNMRGRNVAEFGNFGGSARRSVSRVLSLRRPDRTQGRGWPFIWDGCRQPPRATYPDGRPETAHPPPLFGLAPGEACRAVRLLPAERGALLPHPFTLALPVSEARFEEEQAVCFLWRWLGGRPRRALPGTVFPWSPDFPHPAGFPRWQGATIRPPDRKKLGTPPAGVKRRRRRAPGAAPTRRRSPRGRRPAATPEWRSACGRPCAGV